MTEFSKVSMNKALKIFPEMTKDQRNILLRVRNGEHIRKRFPNTRQWLWDQGAITSKMIYHRSTDVLTKVGEALVHLIENPPTTS